MGYAAALSMLLLVVSLAVTLLVLRNSNRWVHAQGGAEVMATTVDAPASRSGRRSSRRTVPARSGASGC